MNVTIKINIEKFNETVDLFQEKFNQATGESLLQMSREAMLDIIDNTVGPPPQPSVKYYKRTGTWAGGWYAAARTLGLNIPTTKDTPRIKNSGIPHGIINTKEEVSFIAENNVDYALAIEESGTWRTPWPSRRPPYRYVADAIESEHAEERFKNIIQEQVNNIIT